MRKSLILLFLASLAITGCYAPYYTGVDFVRKVQKEDAKKPYFKSNDVVYFSQLEPSSIIYINKDGVLDANKEEDLEAYQDMIDYWNMEEKNDYGYETPSLFLSSEYNLNLSKKFQYVPEATNAAKYPIPRLELFPYSALENCKFVINTQKTIKNPQEIAVIEPANLIEFCANFLEIYPEATHVVLASNMIITMSALTYSVSYDAQNVKHAGTILVSKSIIDLQNKEIVGYDLNQTPIFYSVFIKIKSGLKKGFGLEGSRLRKYF